MEITFEKHDIEIDILNNPMFQWTQTLNLPQVVDWNQLQYQNIYHTPEYVASKFLGNYSNIPGFDKIIDKIAVHTSVTLPDFDITF